MPRYVNWPTNFWGLPLKIEMAPTHLKRTNFVLSAFT